MGPIEAAPRFAPVPEEEPAPASPAQPSLDLTPEELEAAYLRHQAQALEGGSASAAGMTGASIGGFLATLLRDHCAPPTKQRKLPAVSCLALALK